MNLSILARCGLFRGIETAELSPLLRRLHACTREFDKFQPIYRLNRRSRTEPAVGSTVSTENRRFLAENQQFLPGFQAYILPPITAT